MEKSGWMPLRLAVLLVLLCAVVALPSLAVRTAEEAPLDQSVPAPELPPEELAPEEEPVEESPTEELPAPFPDPDKPMLALTFDDGPGAYTDRLLDALAQHNAKATFFVVGRNIEGYRDALLRVAAEGHEIGSHSWSHPQLTKLDAAAATEQITTTRDKIREVTGVETNLLRPPYGAVNSAVKSLAAEQGAALIFWSVDPRDWALRDADKVYDAVMSTAADGKIILCHDIHSTTVDAMERLIPDLQAQGYQLVTVTQLLTSRGGEVTPGSSYRERPAETVPAQSSTETSAQVADKPVEQAAQTVTPPAQAAQPADTPEGQPVNPPDSAAGQMQEAPTDTAGESAAV